MKNLNRLFSSVLALALAALLFACSKGPSAEAPPVPGNNSGASSGNTQQKCLAAADVSNAVGLEMQEFAGGTRSYGDHVVCAYRGTDDKLGAFVTIAIGPAQQAAEVFEEMRKTVKLFLGASAEPEVIPFGERGQAYGSMSKSEAVVVSGGRLYRAEIVSSASADIGDKKAGLIEIVKKLVGR